jgi:F0F1-type ATP synthase membrane subunit b/b'
MNTLIFPAVNLILLLGFIVYKTKQPFKDFMQKRHSDVFDGLNRSKIQAAAAATKQKEVEKKLLNLDAERIIIAQEWKQRETQQIAALHESSARVVAQMRKESDQNKKSLEVSLEADILRNFKRNVIAQAETKIKSALNSETHAKLNQSFTQELGSGTPMGGRVS